MVKWFIVLFPLLIFPWGFEIFESFSYLIYLYIFVASSWLLLLKRREHWYKNIDKPITGVEYCIILLLVLLIISTINSINPFISLFGMVYRFEGLFTIVCYLSMFIFSYRLTEINNVQNLINKLLIVGVFVSIYGILEHYSLDFLPIAEEENSKRIESFFGNPNFFGSYLVLVTMLAIPLYLNAANKRNGLIYLSSISIFTVATLFTYTRSAWLAIFIGVLVFSLFILLKKRSLLKKGILLVLVLVSIVISTDFLEKGAILSRVGITLIETRDMMDEVDGNEGAGRFAIWKLSLPYIKEYFWTGSGPDTFYYSIYIPEEKEFKKFDAFKEHYVDKAHNEFLQIAITLGVPSLIVYLLIITLILFQSIKAIRYIKGNDYILQIGLSITIFAYLVQSFFNISVVPVAPIFWSLLGITYGVSIKHIRNAKKDFGTYPILQKKAI